MNVLSYETLSVVKEKGGLPFSLDASVLQHLLESIINRFQGQTHQVDVAVSPRLTNPLIIGTNWAKFQTLFREGLVDKMWMGP